MAARAGEIRKLTTLLEVSQALSNALEIGGALHRTLEIVGRQPEVRGAVIVLLDEASGELVARATHGATGAIPTKGRIGEGPLGRVVATQEPLVAPKGRCAADGRWVAAPVVVDRRAIGALALSIHGDLDLERVVEFLRVVSSMIAQALKVSELVDSERRRLLDENRTLRRELIERYDYANIVGRSGPMRQVFEQIAQVAAGGTTVLIRGESGTGKERIAHAIHYASPRAQGPFVRVSCAALPESLVESELFGHERGAFTGALARKKGRFELAEGGTLFLDEIGELSPSTQAKLLRVLQEREFERVGGTETLVANVRLVAATNRDLERAIAEGTFREDLYYRLDVFSIYVPPLRDRKPDVTLLADHFLAKYAREQGKRIKRISTAAIDLLASYHWPGNVRELENAIERAVVVCDGSVIHAHHLPPTLQTAEASGTLPTTSLADATAIRGFRSSSAWSCRPRPSATPANPREMRSGRHSRKSA